MYILFQFQFAVISTEVEIREQILVYTWDNFFADIGGFMGLLLGSSIYSLADMMIETLQKLL